MSGEIKTIQKQSSCSVVVPVYNGADTLRELVTRLSAVLPSLYNEYEIILVNDGSPDNSWQVTTDLISDFPHIRGINLMRNNGQHNALLCGIRSARNEYTLTLDDDLQEPPEEIHKLVEKMTEGYDVVYGIPVKLPHSALRNFFSRFTKRVIAYAMGNPNIRNISTFRLFKTELRKAFDTYSSPNVMIDALLSWGTINFGTTPVNEMPREIGSSNYNFVKLMSMAFLVMTNFSTAPLRFASMLGFGITLFGMVILVYVLILALIEGSVPGFPFLASIITIFSGSQILTLGIFGEYLGSIFTRSTERPPYVIRETLEK